MLVCWQYPTVASSQSGQHSAEMVMRTTLVCLTEGFTAFCIQTISAMGKCPSKLERQWDPGTVLLLSGSSGGALALTWPPLILRGGRFCSQCLKLQELGVQFPCSDTDFLYDLVPVTWPLSVSVSYRTIKASLTLRTRSLLFVRG